MIAIWSQMQAYLLSRTDLESLVLLINMALSKNRLKALKIKLSVNPNRAAQAKGQKEEGHFQMMKVQALKKILNLTIET